MQAPSYNGKRSLESPAELVAGVDASDEAQIRLSLWPVSMQVMKRKCLYSTAGHASNVLFIIQNQSIRALPVLLPRPQTKN